MKRALPILILFLAFGLAFPALGQRGLSISSANAQIVAPPDAVSAFGLDNGIPQTNSATTNGTVPLFWNGAWIYVNTNKIAGTGGGGGQTNNTVLAAGGKTVQIATNTVGGTTTYTLTGVQSAVLPGPGVTVTTNVGANGATNYTVTCTTSSTFNPNQFFSSVSTGNTNLQTNQTLGHLDLNAGAAQGTNLFSTISTNDPRGIAFPLAASNKFITSYDIAGVYVHNTNWNIEPEFYMIGGGNGAGGGGSTNTGAPFDFVLNQGDQNPSSPIPMQADLYFSGGTGNLWVAGNITNFGEILTQQDVKAEAGFSTPGGMFAALGSFTSIVAGNLLLPSALKLTANTTLEQTTPTHVSLIVGGNDGTNHQETIVTNGTTPISFTGKVNTGSFVNTNTFSSDGGLILSDGMGDISILGNIQTRSTTASAGFAGLNTNFLTVANPTSFSGQFATINAGFTNTTFDMDANVQGASGTIVFYARGGATGGTPAANPAWTNTIVAAGESFRLPFNCGFQVVSGVSVSCVVYP